MPVRAGTANVSVFSVYRGVVAHTHMAHLTLCEELLVEEHVNLPG